MIKVLNVFVLLFVSFISFAQNDDYVQKNYDKTETTITMRDGIKLYTVIYSPKNTSKAYPILFQRTPYSCQPYGKNEFRPTIGPSEFLMKVRKHYCISRCSRPLDERRCLRQYAGIYPQ